MDYFAFVVSHLGVVLFSVITIALIFYLIRTMLHPESYEGSPRERVWGPGGHGPGRLLPRAAATRSEAPTR